MRSSRTNCSLTTEFALVQENILLQNERITQLYVIQSEQSPFLWFGILFAECGIYKGAVMRFSMYIDDSYPHCACPKIVFSPIPYHPLVNPMTGELDTKNAFPNWDSDSRKLYELLLFVKRVIRQADEYIVQIRDLLKAGCSSLNVVVSEKGDQVTSSNQDEPKNGHDDEHPKDVMRSLQDHVIATSTSHKDTLQNLSANEKLDDSLIYSNQDAFEPEVKNLFHWFHHTLECIQVFENEPDEFNRRVDEFKQRCLEQLFDRPALCGDDMNALVFTPWDMDIHEPIRSCVLAGRFTPSTMFATYHKETDSVSFVPGHEPERE